MNASRPAYGTVKAGTTLEYGPVSGDASTIARRGKQGQTNAELFASIWYGPGVMSW